MTKKRIVTATTIAVTILAFVLTACSGKKGEFSIEGRFLNMNQAEFYAYSPDGAIDGIDTIHVQGGRFTYQKPINQNGTIVIVFPNFATLPVFVEDKSSISIEGNAAHLKDTEVTGTDDNELFTEWRKNTSELPPPELKKHAEQFIHEHPATAPARWLLLQHYITCPKPEYKKAKSLLGEIMKATNNSNQATRMMSMLNKIGELNIGDRLPSFTARDINGNTVSSSQLTSGTTAILLWASWNYESQNILRQLANNQRMDTQNADLVGSNNGNKIDHVVTICIDPDVKLCRKTLKMNNSENVITICDGKMLESPLIRILGLNNIPDDIKLQDGKVTGRGLPANRLTEK